MPKILLISLSVPSNGQKVTMGWDGNIGSREETLCLVAGAADFLVDGLRGVARRLPGLADVRQELRARGELALRRNGTEPLAHMEVLARRAAERHRNG
jgi:hypothetical protein